MELTMIFGIDTVQFSRKLRERNEFEIKGQYLRSATSVGANVFEAQETHFWLKLCQLSEHLLTGSKLMSDLESILKILTRIIFSTKSSK